MGLRFSEFRIYCLGTLAVVKGFPKGLRLLGIKVRSFWVWGFRVFRALRVWGFRGFGFWGLSVLGFGAFGV